ncbi:hypothetical protein K505DRAFT_81248 [Melanomma pulvis-pyrius CBS 109.77]|uniref:CR-type domain-containing protein n=1 Tax=Melanomma pulvis-pyrius CBS 109.77 TaxID=1314802 RepID=A0A6A6X2A9_9PLEO|nr:hypothetical protein K505DRAFT_81248 [Melanomma pulvis-pyrius CBS 109.77]
MSDRPLCDNCNGTGRQLRTCFPCRGWGTLTNSYCDACEGEGKFWAPELKEWRECYTCSGTGRHATEVTCTDCHGDGNRIDMCISCWGSGVQSTTQSNAQ